MDGDYDCRLAGKIRGNVYVHLGIGRVGAEVGDLSEARSFDELSRTGIGCEDPQADQSE